MKKILISTLIILAAGNLGIACAETITPQIEQDNSAQITAKKKFFSKLKLSKRRSAKTITADNSLNTVQTGSIFDAQNNNNNNKKVELKRIEEIQAEQSQKGGKSKSFESKAESRLSIKERQAALADKISNDELSEEINASTSLQGGVEENVIISVDDCVKLALYNNPAIRYSISNADLYKSKIAQAWAEYFPKFSLGTAYSKNKMLATNFEFPNMKYDLWNAVAVEGSLLLYDFGKTRQNAKMAKKTYEASISDLQSAINDTVYNVKAAYYNYLFALRQQQVLLSTVDKYNKHYMEAKAGYEVGVKAKIDVVTAEYNLSNAKLDLIKAKNSVEIAKAELNNTLGLPSYSNYNVIDNTELERYNLDFDSLIDEAYNLRPELQSVTKKAEASKVLVTSSKLAFTPNLQGFGNYTLGGKRYADNYGYQFGVKLSYPTTNFFLLKKQIDEAKATHERDLAEIDRKRNDVYLDVKTAYLDYVNAKDSIPVAHKAMNEAKLQYEIAAGRYKTGLNTAVELKDAEVTYRNAQLNYYNSLLLYNTSIAKVEKTVGSPIKPVQSENETNDEAIDIKL